MNRLYVIITLLFFAQIGQSQQPEESYEQLWKKVQQLEYEALTKSALKVVSAISEKAKREKNSAQRIKALLYTSKYAMILEEDAQLRIITNFKQEIEEAALPTKNILESYLANLYWQFFQQNRYTFYNRTKTETKVDTTDFRTWDLTTLFEEIQTHFERSLDNENALKKIPVSQFKELLNQQAGSEDYRPTLFDLLAHTALQFYKTPENSITRPANTFKIDDPNILCGAETFTQIIIDVSDKTSLQARALVLYQKLIELHANSPHPYRKAQIDIERLQFTYANAIFPNKEHHYLEVLTNAAEASKGRLASSLYNYEIAALYHTMGMAYQPKVGEAHRWKKKEALVLCEMVIKSFPESRGAEKCKGLKSQILASELQLTTEEHIPVQTMGRLLITYRNQDSLALTAYKASRNQLKQLKSLDYDEQLSFIEKLNVAKTWKAPLKNEQDYQQHTMEVILPALKSGQYVVLAKSQNEGDQSFGFSPVQVTDIVLTEIRMPDYHRFQVIHRNTGKPLAEAEVRLEYQVSYNGPKKYKTFVSNAMGIVQIPLSKEPWSDVDVSVTLQKEKAYFDGYYINRNYTRNRQKQTYSCFLFTDRSIYRPGQPLYFKGIAIQENDGKSAILENTSITLELRDVNNQVKGTQTFKTNDYGSFSGEFILPNNGLTGNYSLQVRSKEVQLNGYASFSVEEYKRPKFTTFFEPVTETFKVNDTITVTGLATAYAGSSITNAKVTYSVKRVVNFPRWFYWYYPFYATAAPQQITYGETLTDASGKYTIDFKAIPDNDAQRGNLPTFQYEVIADVTDINGETHSTSTVVKVGYHTMNATIYWSDVVDKDQKNNSFRISTTNLNGQFVPTTGTVKIYKIKASENVIRPRPWQAPDYENWDKTEFHTLFPHDAYAYEGNVLRDEKRGALVWEANFNTGETQELFLGNIKNWDSGKYMALLESNDPFGQTIKDITVASLFSKKDKKLADNELFHIKTDTTVYATGEKAEVTLLSNSEDLTVSIFIEKDRKIIESKLIHLNRNSKTFMVPITNDDVGGFSISYSFSAYNSFQSGSIRINVPYPTTDLQIETLTFRDKLKPGTDETWSFKIKGPKGDKVTAEVLTSMYDASLDSFKGHSWAFNPLAESNYYSNTTINAYGSFGTTAFNMHQGNDSYYYYKQQSYDTFNWFGLYFGYTTYFRGGRLASVNRMAAAPMEVNAEEDMLNEVVAMESSTPQKENRSSDINVQKAKEKEASRSGESSFDTIKIRKNLQETAFFFPQLQTDKEGNLSFSFTTPEALTKWRLQLLAHTKTLESGILNVNTVTQKELMVVPNAPRFLREGDEITISTKIANLTDTPLSGSAKLLLTDAIKNKDITMEVISKETGQKQFKVDSLGNTQVSWHLKIPKGIQAIEYRVLAKAGDFSDGEQNLLPVLTNRMLVTETLPLWVRSDQTKTFTLEKLKRHTSTTLSNHRLTLEITSNPAWYAVQALPYLMEYPYECNEQTFSRYYANTLASHITNVNPNIKKVFDTWRDSDVLLSNLEKNQDLKALLIQETPWLRDTQSETEQKKRIALLFNLDKMKNEQASALYKLKNNQKQDGAWAWFRGGPSNRYITQHIITGLGHLHKLTSTGHNQQQMVENAISYLDDEFMNEYRLMKKRADDINKDHLTATQIHYLYMRSFFKNIKTSKKLDEITAYYKGQAQKYWINKGLYSKGMLALLLHRMGDSTTANTIIRSLEENSITSEELGMYWKENTTSWYWYKAPVETQSLLIEAFGEIQNNVQTLDNLKIWLLKNKQTNQWKTTKATTEAIYALLLQGTDWISVTETVDVLIGGQQIDPTSLEDVKLEAGTGYFKTAWNGKEITPKMAEVQISKKNEGIAWGALYWQYFEDLDKITPAKTPLQLEKKLFLKKNTDTGEKLTEITKGTVLDVGDLVTVRIELKADRPMEFVHMKDKRAASFEPINVISTYKWQDGLGYYESTRDASTNFFFDYLPKGVHVFEYNVRVNNAGNFSNGITTIQSMYAPEFSSHSEGVRVVIQD